MNVNDGKFTAPIDGIYFFHSTARSYGSNSAQIIFNVNGSLKTYARRDENDEYDTVTLLSQFNLNKGDTVWVYFSGTFYVPTDARFTFFEGHLIRQINS